MASSQPATPDPKKKRRKSTKTKPGDRISLFALIALMADFDKKQGHGPGYSVYIDFPGGGRTGSRGFREGSQHAPLLWVIRLQFQTVVKWALEGRIRECVHLEPEPRCRCVDCDKARVKKPRGPKGDKPSPRSAMSHINQVALLNARGVKWPPPPPPSLLGENHW